MKAFKYWKSLLKDNFSKSKSLVLWKQHIRDHWGKVCINNSEISGSGAEVGVALKVKAEIYLGELNPDDVVVQIYSGPLDVDRNIVESSSESMVCLGPSENGTYTYEGFIPCDESGLFGYSVRIFPSHVDMADNFHLELMRWINNPETISSPVNKSKFESVSV